MSTDSPGQDEPGIDERVGKVMKEQELMAVTQAEAETEQQKKRQRAELADHRTKLLKAVKVEAPDLAAPLFEKLSALAHENHEFAPREVVDLLKAHKARFKDEPDFFDLGIAQREDLLDRVGFYRGVVIDHALSNPVEAGFRDVLMRSDAGDKNTKNDDEQDLNPTQLLYRKPNFSGYFENYYTTSNSVFQTQKNGVTNLSFSLGVAAGRFGSSVGLGASLAKYGRQEESSGYVGKTVYTTANFYLPKIELSFNKSQSCASREFFDACTQALSGLEETGTVSGSASDESAAVDQRWLSAFQKLKDVLDDFGHFVPLQTLIGGRLFATEKKFFEGNEKSSDFTDRFGASVKASLSTIYVDAEVSGGIEKSKQEATKAKSSNETQSMTFNAIGGEGTVVQDAAAWAESLYDYRRWASVQRENLVPSINFLPHSLRDKCWRVLSKLAESCSKRDLLNIHNAFFLFYGEYGNRVGQTAREVYFSIESHAFSAAVASDTVVPSEGQNAVLVEPGTAPSQLWRMTENGQMVLMATGRKSAHGEVNHINFALTVDLSAGDKTASLESYPVKLTQLSNEPSQVWDYPGSGELTCRALGNDYVLEAVTASTLCMKKRASAGRESHLWFLAEVPSGTEKKVNKAPENEWVKIVLSDRNLVFSVAQAESLGEINKAEIRNVIAQPDINGRHQLWHRESSGHFVSALSKVVNGQAVPLLLSADEVNGAITASPSRPDLVQKWSVTSAGELKAATVSSADKSITAFNDQDMAVTGSALILKERKSPPSQKLTIEAYKGEPDSAVIFFERSCQNLFEPTKVVSINTRPLILNGSITGIVFFLEGLRGSGEDKQCVLHMELCVRGDDGKDSVVSHERGQNEYYSDILDDNHKTLIETDYLYLPPSGSSLYSLRMAVSNNKHYRSLRFEYQAVKDGEWHYFSNHDLSPESSLISGPDMDVALRDKTTATTGERIIAIGFDAKFKGDKTMQIAPKIITAQI
ncbi:hypothetical protein [Pantoea ananatis]|uniref:hypothetical protein n=1 Tax=Pantoea ananas TaxID=553 RepID=UPI0021F70014|nr:hypothetical protein [Pantoea ananatis]MCW0351000.1 hypothetical protein [Pantoea ananatis]